MNIQTAYNSLPDSKAEDNWVIEIERIDLNGEVFSFPYLGKRDGLYFFVGTSVGCTKVNLSLYRIHRIEVNGFDGIIRIIYEPK